MQGKSKEIQTTSDSRSLAQGKAPSGAYRFGMFEFHPSERRLHRRNKRVALEEALLLTGAARPRYLADACRHDSTMRRHVEALLAAHDQAATFLETPARATLDEADALVRTNQERFWATPIARLREQLP
jgi:hypothetical protein